MREKPEVVFDRLADFLSYPRFASSIRSVTVDEQGDSWCISTWEADFRSGVMRWTERDLFLKDEGRIEFEQIEGDLGLFNGRWEVLRQDDDVRVVLDIQFDLGLPTLAELLEPVAARALDENMRKLMHGFFGDGIEVVSASEEVVFDA